MSLITRMRKQKAVYWPPGPADGNGQPTWGAPVELSCRWDDDAQQYLDAAGETRVSNAYVYVDRDLALGGLLRLGLLSATLYPAEPRLNDAVYEIRKLMRNPNLRATESLRTAVV